MQRVQYVSRYVLRKSIVVPVGADDDLSAVALALHLDPQPLSVLQLRVDRWVEAVQRAVVDAIGLVGAAQGAFAVRRNLNAVLEGRGDAKLLSEFLTIRDNCSICNIICIKQHHYGKRTSSSEDRSQDRF